MDFSNLNDPKPSSFLEERDLLLSLIYNNKEYKVPRTERVKLSDKEYLKILHYPQVATEDFPVHCGIVLTVDEKLTEDLPEEHRKKGMLVFKEESKKINLLSWLINEEEKIDKIWRA